jgi:hypothetical protein
MNVDPIGHQRVDPFGRATGSGTVITELRTSPLQQRRRRGDRIPNHQRRGTNADAEAQSRQQLRICVKSRYRDTGIRRQRNRLWIGSNGFEARARLGAQLN